MPVNYKSYEFRVYEHISQLPVPYSLHRQIQRKEPVWPGKNRCAGDHSDSVRV